MKKLIQRTLKRMNFDVVVKREEIKYPPDFDKLSIEVINRVNNYTMTSVERLFSLINSTKYIVNNNIEGDFVECGVWRGGSAMAIAHTLSFLSHSSRKIHLFDTFSGMSSPTNKDISYCGIDAETALKESDINNQSSVWCYASIEEVMRNMTQTGYDMDKVNFIKGKVEDTIPQFAPDKIALLRLDTDWYESTYHELKHLFPRIVKGGVIIIDDYGYWKGCREAVDQYIQENNIQILLNRIDMTGRTGIKL